jgi:hypothetical protein
MSNDGEQRQVKQVRLAKRGARDSALLPTAHAPAIVSAARADVSGFGVRRALELLLGQNLLQSLERGA